MNIFFIYFRKNLWEVRLADMALQLHLIDDCRLLAALANGSLAVLEVLVENQSNSRKF